MNTATKKTAVPSKGATKTKGDKPVVAVVKPAAKASPKPVEAPAPAAAPKASAKPKAEGKAKPLSCLDAAVVVLKASKEPLACKAMINAMFSQKLWASDAPTPWATLYSAILREIVKKGLASRFKKTERGLFTLKSV